MSIAAGYKTDASTLLWYGVGLILAFAPASYLYSYLYDECLFWTGQVSSFFMKQGSAIPRVELRGSKLQYVYDASLCWPCRKGLRGSITVCTTTLLLYCTRRWFVDPVDRPCCFEGCCMVVVGRQYAINDLIISSIQCQMLLSMLLFSCPSPLRTVVLVPPTVLPTGGHRPGRNHPTGFMEGSCFFAFRGNITYNHEGSPATFQTGAFPFTAMAVSALWRPILAGQPGVGQ